MLVYTHDNSDLNLIINIYVWLKIRRSKAVEKLGWYIIGLLNERRSIMLKKGQLDSFKLYYEQLNSDLKFKQLIRHRNYKNRLKQIS